MERVYLTYKGKNEMFFEGIYNSSDGFIYVGYTRCELSQDHPKIYRDITKINGFMKVPACVCTQEASLNIIPQLYFYSWDNVIFTNGVPEIIKDEFVKFVQEEINKVYL